MASPNGRVDGKTNGTSAIRFLWIEDWYGNAWRLEMETTSEIPALLTAMTEAQYADKVYKGLILK